MRAPLTPPTTMARNANTRALTDGRAEYRRSAFIFGASLAPYIATWLAQNYGLQYVGYYVLAAALLTLIGLVSIRETNDQRL